MTATLPLVGEGRTAPGGRKAPRGRGLGRGPRRSALRSLPLVPSVALLGVFLLGPIAWSFVGSFTDSALSGASAMNPSFIGLDNYLELAQDPDFPKSVVLTLVFVIASALVGQNLLGLALALMLETSHKVVRSIVTTVVVSSWVLPEIVAAFAMYAFFHVDGTLNTAADGLFGLQLPDWLYDHPMLAVVIANIWRGTAFSMMVYAAAVQEVPEDVQEAAQLDGADGWQRLVLITIPMIRRSITTNLMLTTLQTLSVFTLIYVMTAGGPGTDSATLPIFAYQAALKFGQIGYGTAIATVMLLLGAVFSFIYIRVLRPETD